MKLKRRNLEVDYLSDMITHNGFLIEKEDKWAPINVDQLVNHPNYLNNEYRCDCGAFMGQDVLGQKCPRCGSEISLHSLNFNYTGWLDISPHYIISPVYYNILKKALGQYMLKFILGDYKYDMTVQYNENDTEFQEEQSKKKKGRISTNDIRYIIKKIPKSKQHLKGIGHNAFKERFEEILQLCASKQHMEEIEILLAEKNAVFISKIPIYSTAYRPESKTSEAIYYPKINKWFSRIVSVNFRLPNMRLDAEINGALNHMQNDLIEACDQLIRTEMSKKHGFVRSEIVGGTFSFSFRSVIILGCDLQTDEIDIPYSMAIEGFVFRITYILATRYHMTLEQAYQFVNTHDNNEIVDGILDEIIAEGQWVFLLREPTNGLPSIALMRIRKYKKNDDTISIPVTTLEGYNADFDGDALNGAFLGSQKDKIIDAFEAFHYSCLTNYVTNEYDISWLQWCDVSIGRISE